MLLPLVLATAIGSPLFGRQLDQRGSRVVILVGLVLAATGFILLWLTGSGQSLFYIGGIFIGLGMSVLAGSSLRYIMLNEVDAVDRAATQGVLTIFISLGQLTGSALIGMITAEMTGVAGYRQVFFYLGLVLALLLLAALQLKDRETELATIVGAGTKN
jgi:MFS family permease